MRKLSKRETVNEALHSHTILSADFERAAWDAGNVKDDTHCKNSKASRVEIEIFESIVVVVVDYLVWGYVCAVSCSCVSLLLMVLLLFDKHATSTGRKIQKSGKIDVFFIRNHLVISSDMFKIQQIKWNKIKARIQEKNLQHSQPIMMHQSKPAKLPRIVGNQVLLKNTVSQHILSCRWILSLEQCRSL